jgi:hypothetical protein
MWLLRFLWLDITELCSGDDQTGKRLTELLKVKYASTKEKRAVFINVTTVMLAPGRVGQPTGTFSASAHRDRRIIPVKTLYPSHFRRPRRANTRK